MVLHTLYQPVLVTLLAVVASTGKPVEAEPIDARLYEAFYLEKSQQDWAAAAKLYEAVASDRRADRGARTEAKARLAACREELATADFARLMPPDTLVYIELNQPGKQVLRLLGQLGLLADAQRAIAEGGRQIAVSPELITEVLGIRGAALAVTGFDPQHGDPNGVIVLHPGDVDIVRGLIETALPVGGTAVEPIGGNPTFKVQGEVFVTLTSRLVIASDERAQIEGVVSRLTGKTKKSLASSAAAAEALANRKDSLVSFFVNVQPLMPMLRAQMASHGDDAKELAMAELLLDLDSLQSLAGGLGVGDDGLFFNIGVGLDEDHHNLVYNLLRTPAINPETLKCVPEGVAAVFVAAVNSADSQYRSGPAGEANVVTAFDFGRELFANVTSVALFALPPEGKQSRNGPPIPDVALAITVNDPDKSEALWTTILGVAGMAAGAPAVEGEPIQLGGATVSRFNLPDGVRVYFTTAGNDLLIAATPSAMERAVLAKRKGRNILGDEGFAAALASLTKSSTKGLFLHAGRCAQIAKRFMPERELREAGPVFELLTETVASLVIDHSKNAFRVSASVNGIPEVGGLISKIVTREIEGDHGRARHARATQHEEREATESETKTRLDEGAPSADLLRKKFMLLAAAGGEREAALKIAKAWYERSSSDATQLNRFAWALLTEDKFDGAFNGIALKFSERSNELTKHKDWRFLDTLAVAKFKTGDAPAAIALELKAIELCDGEGVEGLKVTLARFQRETTGTKLAKTQEKE